MQLWKSKKKMKPSLLVCYDYEMIPWQIRVPFSMTYLMHQALKEYFNVYKIGEKNENEVDFVFNMLPMGKDSMFFRKGKKTLFWNPTPLEGLCPSESNSSDVVLVASHELAKKLGEKGRVLHQGVNPHYVPHDEEQIYDVVFLGSEIEGYRIDLLNRIDEQFNLRRGSADGLGGPSAQELSKGKLVLSIEDYYSQAAGIEHRFWTFGNVRPILMQRNYDFQDAGFIEGEHFIGYDGIEECLEKIDYYLGHMDEAEKMHKNLREEFKKNHTYGHRAKEVYEICKQL